MPYTEFVIIGGDGLFNQLINAFHNHLDSDTLMKMPIGIIPGGSTNAIACDLGGKNPYEACSNIIRGHTSSWDILRVQFKNLDKIVYTTTLTWGLVSDIVHDGEEWRKLFGSSRYFFWGAKHFWCSCTPKTYRTKIYVQRDEQEKMPIEETKVSYI